jgi:hypothetical protein
MHYYKVFKSREIQQNGKRSEVCTLAFLGCCDNHKMPYQKQEKQMSPDSMLKKYGSKIFP